MHLHTEVSVLAKSLCVITPYLWKNLRFTIQPSLAAIRTIGLTPVAEIAATASCICQSFLFLKRENA